MLATAFALILCLVLSYVVLQRTKKQQPSHPPGPPPKPIIGNALDIPFTKPWVKYMEWSKKFNSDIIHLCAMNTHIVALNRMEDVVELMEKRSRNYSSRPYSPVAELIGIEKLTLLLPYGGSLRKQRRFLEESFRKEAVQSCRHILEERVHLLLDNFLQDPAEFDEYCNLLVTSVTLATTFGYDIIPGKKKDRFVELGRFAITAMSELMMPGKTLIAVFPFLRHIPPWFPGASSQRFGAQIRNAFTEHKRGSFEHVKNNMAAGTAKDSIAKRLFERGEGTDGSLQDEELLKEAISTVYLAGVETSHIVMSVFILAMILHPMEQKRAQEEIDRVVGSDRLPNFEDRSSLPYVEALYREVLRWRPPAPLAFPRLADEDDVYKGYHIPKGTIVLANVWAITRNEAVYSEPEAFRPERFIKDDGTLIDDNMSYVFGFGRRICPGKLIADAVLWLMITSVLATFNISKAKDEEGNVIDVDAGTNRFTDAVTSRPLPFKCSITPRSQQAESLIRHAADAVLHSLDGR